MTTNLTGETFDGETGGAVPFEACALPASQQPFRLAEFEDLITTALRTVERPGPGRLLLRLSGAAGVESQVRDLTAREAECCRFFDFDVRRRDDGVDVDVRVPPERTGVLDALERRARAAAGGAHP